MPRWGIGVALIAAFVGAWLIHHRGTARPVLPDSGGRQGRCALWFIGSSSISRWTTLARDMQPWVGHNRGLGGSSIERIRYLFAEDRETVAPAAIILYVGENDILAGHSVERTLADLEALLRDKRRRFGAMPTFVILLKPAPARAANWPRQALFNDGVRALVRREADVRLIDVVQPMEQGGPPARFFGPDGVHLNDQGYRLWTGVIRAALKADLPRDALAECRISG